MQFAHRVCALKFNEVSYWPFLSREFAHRACNLNLMGFATAHFDRQKRLERRTGVRRRENGTDSCASVGGGWV